MIIRSFEFPSLFLVAVAETVVGRCSIKKFTKFCKTHRKSTCVRVHFSIKLQSSRVIEIHKSKCKTHKCLNVYHCVKSVRIRSFSGPNFPAYGQNTERYILSLRIQSERSKIQTRKTLNTDNFHAVYSTTKKTYLLCKLASFKFSNSSSLHLN